MYFVKIIVKKEVRELIKEHRLLLMIAVTSFLMLFLPYDLFSKLYDFDASLLNLAVDFYIRYFSILVVLFIAYSATYTVFFGDKIKRNLDSLLATPISIQHIWVGKTLAIFLIAYALSFFLSVAFIVLINISFDFERLLLPDLFSTLSFFIINPIICLTLIGNLGILYFISRDDTKIRIGFFLLIMIIFYFARPDNLLLVLSLSPFLVLLSLILVGITLLSSRLLTKERVILSAD